MAVADPHAKTVLALPDIPPDGTTDVIDDPDARAFVGLWIGDGSAVPRHKPSSWVRKRWQGVQDCTNPRDNRKNLTNCWGPRVRERVAGQLCCIRHWTVVVDYRELPRELATYVVDPPYKGRPGRHYPTRKLDYPAVASWVDQLEGLVIFHGGPEDDWHPRLQPWGAVSGLSVRGENRRSAERLAVWDTCTGEELTPPAPQPRRSISIL